MDKIYPSSRGTVTVYVYNTTSMTSLLYGIYPNFLNPPMEAHGNDLEEYEGVAPASAGADNGGCKNGSQ